MFPDYTYRWLRWLNRGLAGAGLGWVIYWIAPPEPPHYFIAFIGVGALFALWLVIRHLVRRVRDET
jgi:hypothetical protein